MSDKEFEKVTRKESDYKINQMFITNIDKLNCIKYNSFNGLSGGRIDYQFNIEKDNKWLIVSFLREHPIDKLINGVRDSMAHDLDHWEISFIFENSSLNQSIKGYGITEDSSPYVTEFIYMLQKNQILENNQVPLWLRKRYNDDASNK